MTDPLAEARAAFKRRDWMAARAGYSAAREQGQVFTADDAYAAADAAWWLGLVDESLGYATEAFNLYLAQDAPRQAAVTAFGMAYTYSLRGDGSLASAWMSRGMRLLEGEPEGVEHGYLATMDVDAALAEGDLTAAIEHARRIGRIGRRFDDKNLLALAAMSEGRALLKQGRVADGMRLLDEAMLAAVSDELEPSWAGNIYCHLMDACHELMDHRRANEWTEATARWCESMPGAGPFMGICRVHRCHVLEVRGEWGEAEREAQRVCDELSHFHVSIVAEAHYEVGVLRRLRGDLAGAEEALGEAHQLGRQPQPALALLRLSQGRIDTALASIRAALAAAVSDGLARARLNGAVVEIALAAGEVADARAASHELDQAAVLYGSSGLQAVAAHARGAVLLAEGQPARAADILRRALACWRDLSAPYEMARVRLLLGDALEALGDREAATLERQTAEVLFTRVGAGSERRKVELRRAARPTLAGLTPRECEVLELVARGMSNDEIAATLVLSVRTVERHLATVYQKLGLQGRSARAAAATQAVRLGLAPT